MKNGTKTILSREKIAEAQDHQFQLVDVPEWGGSLYVHGLTGAERDRFEDSLITGRGKNRDVNMRNMRSKLLILSCRTGEEPNSPLVFSTDDVEMLGKKSGLVTDRIFKVAQRLAGLSDDEVEELAKGLGEDQSVRTGSD